MADDHVMTLDKGLARLEETVAKGFSEQRARSDAHDARFTAHDVRFDRLENRMARLEDRMAGLESKVDVVGESIHGDIKTVLEAVTAGTEEMRRTTESIRKEHEADRRLTKLILLDHSTRLRDLER